jgi:hypothetical protein
MEEHSDDIQEEEKDSDNPSKLQKIEDEKKEILNRVVSGNINKFRDKVAFILNNFNDARNSDIELAWSYWMYFDSEKFNKNYITKEQLKKVTSLKSLIRVRAKIQNEYKLFQANEEVKRFRGTLEHDQKEGAIQDKPSGIGIYSVYIDETGKTQDYLSVGSLWILEISSLINSALELDKWKANLKIDFEFHFSDLNKNRVSYFKDFFTKFLSLHPAVSFKLIVVNNKGFSNKNAAITDLTYHLLTKGIHHENDTGRAPLPRILQVWLDDEEKGSDELKIENIKERITSQKIDGLFLDDFKAVSSQNNFFIQIIDLFTGAVNRKLHNTDGSNFKDEFADFVLQSLNFDINSIDKTNNLIDNSTLFNLRQQSN